MVSTIQVGYKISDRTGRIESEIKVGYKICERTGEDECYLGQIKDLLEDRES